jgi:hypothetical protein
VVVLNAPLPATENHVVSFKSSFITLAIGLAFVAVGAIFIVQGRAYGDGETARGRIVEVTDRSRPRDFTEYAVEYTNPHTGGIATTEATGFFAPSLGDERTVSVRAGQPDSARVVGTSFMFWAIAGLGVVMIPVGMNDARKYVFG